MKVFLNKQFYCFIFSDHLLLSPIIVSFYCYIKGSIILLFISQRRNIRDLYFCKDNTYFTKIMNIKHETFVLLYQQKTNTQNSKVRRDSIHTSFRQDYPHTSHIYIIEGQACCLSLQIIPLDRFSNYPRDSQLLTPMLHQGKNFATLVFHTFECFVERG